MQQEMGGENTHVSPRTQPPHPQQGFSGLLLQQDLELRFNAITDFLILLELTLESPTSLVLHHQLAHTHPVYRAF